MPKRNWQISIRSLLLSIAIVPPLLAYVSGYFLLSERLYWSGTGGTIVRLFGPSRLAVVYVPMAFIESCVIGDEVYTAGWHGETRLYSYRMFVN